MEKYRPPRKVGQLLRQTEKASAYSASRFVIS